MNDNPTPQEAEALVHGLVRPAAAPVDEPEAERRERERVAAGRRIWDEGRRADALARWNRACPSGMKSSDWTHPGLAPYLPKITRILDYTAGPRGLIASGPSGRGKTRAMWALMRKFCEAGEDAVFYSAFEWFSALQQQVNFGRDDAQGWVEAVARRKIVFIDDLGQQTVQRSREDWAEAWFFRFLDIRVGEGLPLFLTTNMRSKQMAQRSKDIQGDPMIRRMLDVAEPVSFW